MFNKVCTCGGLQTGALLEPDILRPTVIKNSGQHPCSSIHFEWGDDLGCGYRLRCIVGEARLTLVDISGYRLPVRLVSRFNVRLLCSEAQSAQKDAAELRTDACG